MEKTLGLMQKALNWPDELTGTMEATQNGSEDAGFHEPPPLNDVMFKSFLDTIGVLEKSHDLRKTVYATGLEPSLRYPHYDMGSFSQ